MHNKEAKTPKSPVNKPPATVSKTNVKYLKKMYPRAWNMTSRDFHSDPHARIDFMMARANDKETLKSFQKAICYNRHLFIGRRILVLNCGVDFLLTLWALKNGPDHVYGVDTSQSIEYLRGIIWTNKLNGNVTLIQGRVQDIELPVEEVDIIISNWMGYSLLIESKCEDLIYARDKWLKKDTGIIFPDGAQLYAIGIENSKNKNQHVDWWLDVNGFNMNAIRNRALKEPIYQTVKIAEPNHRHNMVRHRFWETLKMRKVQREMHPISVQFDQKLLTEPVKVWSINLYKVTVDQLNFRTPFSIFINRCGSLEGMLTFFDVHFSKSHTPMALSTAPWSPHTNWLQTVFYFDQPMPVNITEKLFCGIQMSPLTDEAESKSYSVIIEVFTGTVENLSLALKMTWCRKSEDLICDENRNPFIILEPPKNVDNDKKESTKTKSNKPSASVLKEQSTQKNSEKKRRMTKKVDASMLFH